MGTSAAGVGPVGVLDKVSRHPDSSVCVSIFALLSAGPAIRRDVPARSAGFQTCRIADFQVGKTLKSTPFAGLETRDTADLEVCATRVSVKMRGHGRPAGRPYHHLPSYLGALASRRLIALRVPSTCRRDVGAPRTCAPLWRRYSTHPRACVATVTDRRHSHLQFSILYLRFHNQSGGKMLKLSMTALLFVTTGTLVQPVTETLLEPTSTLKVLVVMTFVSVLPKRTTARVAISDTT